MKELAKTIGKILFWIFIVVVFFWTASLTLAEVRVILPNEPIVPYFALMLFDGGAVTWLFVFIGHAKGLMQRAIALIMLVLDLAGVVILSAGRLLMGGQTLTDVPETMGTTLVYALIFATLINLVAIYIFHISDPGTMQEIELRTLTDKLEREALDQAKANIELEAQQLGAILAARATARLKYDMRLPMNDQEAARLLADNRAQPAPLVIDARPKDQATPAPSWLAKMRRKFKREQPPSIITQPAVVYEQTIQAAQPAPVTLAGPEVQPPSQEEPPAAPDANFPQAGE